MDYVTEILEFSDGRKRCAHWPSRGRNIVFGDCLQGNIPHLTSRTKLPPNEPQNYHWNNAAATMHLRNVGPFDGRLQIPSSTLLVPGDVPSLALGRYWDWGVSVLETRFHRLRSVTVASAG